MNRKMKQIVLPLLTALIWGSAFVAQKSGGEVLGALSFNWTRYLLASLALTVLVTVRARRGGASVPRPGAERNALLRGGAVIGTLLMISSYLQQYGVSLTTAGKAGFITALYIVIVPLLGLLFGKRVRPVVWCGVGVAVAGLYFLSFAAGGVPVFSTGDLLVIACAFGFSFHILAVDHYTKLADGVMLSCIQFAVAAAESLVLALVFEGFPVRAIAAALPFILYAGLLSGGVGYTLQIVAQKDGDPTVVSLLLSLEAFFAVVSGAILLHERLTPREYLGCALMLCAVVLVQLPEKKSGATLT
ncbi:MAG: DMT family transporter [Ruminococcaceae bacterium]|nr:DMT family transporter [Oscillospiraceae bacterium]